MRCSAFILAVASACRAASENSGQNWTILQKKGGATPLDNPYSFTIPVTFQGNPHLDGPKASLTTHKDFPLNLGSNSVNNVFVSSSQHC